jgi:outer membrane protein TolC
MLVTAPALAQTATATAAPQVFSLDQALQFALDHYPAVAAALAQVKAAAANIDVSKSAYLPRLDAIWQTNRGTANNVFGQLLPQSVIPALSGPVLPSASAASVWGSAAGARFSWEALDLGLRTAQVRESEAVLAGARADEAMTRLTVQHAVAIEFLDVIVAQAAVAVADTDAQRREVLARAVHTLVDNQLRPGAEASRADAELAAARTRSILAHQTLTIAEATLARALGIRADRIAVSGTRLLTTMAPETTVTPSDVTHPALLASEAAVSVMRARENVLARTERPRLYLESSLFARGTGANPDGTFDDGVSGLWPERVNWAAGAQLVFPNVFGLPALRARKAAAAAATRAESARHDETVLTVTMDQRNAETLVASARAIAQNTPIQLAAARQSETQARARYDAGLTGIVEVAEADSLLAAAEYQDASARVGVWRALLAQAVARGALDQFIALVRAAGAP